MADPPPPLERYVIVERPLMVLRVEINDDDDDDGGGDDDDGDDGDDLVILLCIYCFSQFLPASWCSLRGRSTIM